MMEQAGRNLAEQARRMLDGRDTVFTRHNRNGSAHHRYR
jgi:hypothetical protein